MIERERAYLSGISFFQLHMHVTISDEGSIQLYYANRRQNEQSVAEFAVHFHFHQKSNWKKERKLK